MRNGAGNRFFFEEPGNGRRRIGYAAEAPGAGDFVRVNASFYRVASVNPTTYECKVEGEVFAVEQAAAAFLVGQKIFGAY